MDDAGGRRARGRLHLVNAWGVAWEDPGVVSAPAGPWIPPLAVAAGPVAIRATMLPGVDFWDTGELQTIGPILAPATRPAFHLVLLGWLASSFWRRSPNRRSG
jgi:hypothetical protein